MISAAADIHSHMAARESAASMAHVRIKYYVERPGRGDSVRRFWQPGPSLRNAGWRTVRLADTLSSAIAQAEAINSVVSAWQTGGPVSIPENERTIVELALPETLRRKTAGTVSVIPGRPTTLADLILRYRMSDDFRDLRASTRRSYEDNLRALERWGGEAPLEVLTPERFVVLWKSWRAATPTKARGVVSMARIVFSWGRRSGAYTGYRQNGVLIPDNPAARLNIRVPLPERTEADLWTPEEIAIFAAVAEQMGHRAVGLAVEINAWLGQRQGDLLRLTVGQYKGGEIMFRQSKTGARVALPVTSVPDLLESLNALVAMRTGEVVSTNLIFDEKTGLGWTTNSFRHAFDAVRNEAAQWCPSLAGRQFMLLRHTAIVRMAEAGVHAEEIRAISGHTLQSVNQILERYLVRTRKLAESAFQKRLGVRLVN